MVLLYGWLCFEARRSARCLLNVLACLARPPVADMTRGVKVLYVFHFPDSLLISAFLLVFMASVAGCDGRVPVAGGKRVKNSHINEGLFKTPPLQNSFTAMSR